MFLSCYCSSLFGGSGLWMFGFVLIEFPEVLGSRALGFLALWLFDPMTLKLGSAASRSVNDFAY